MMPAKYIKFGVIALVIVILDQLTKWKIFNTIGLYDVVQVIPGFFNLAHIQNSGTAFGLFANHHGLFRSVFLITASVMAICFVLYLFVKTPQEYSLLSAGFALILGGAIGNMIDRLRLGHVIDFIDLYIGTFHWPAFNVADSAITIGMIIFAFYIVFRKTPI